MFKIESYFGPLLMSYLNKYVKLEEESFKLSLWGGDAIFHNLELRYDVLEDLVPLPIGLKSGQVHELSVHVPWTKLGSESVVITLNTVECILALKTDFVHKSKKDYTEPSNIDQKQQKLEKNIPPGYLKSYLVNIINNIQIKVNNLIIKFVEDDIVLSLNAKSLEYLPATNTWSRGFIDFSSGNLLVHKVVQVSDLTVCLDQMDANGHIKLYQEPILYRCSVECRFVLSYQSFSSNKPDFLKFNIQFGNLELNVTTSQMPPMRRLVELFYALYYNTINWDAVVGCGFANQIISSSGPEKEAPRLDVTVEAEDVIMDENQSSWGSWAWSYVPSLFAYEDEMLDDDNSDPRYKSTVSNKRTLIFGMNFDSLQINLKKSQTVKFQYGSQRLSRFQKTILFMTIKVNNIGLNVISRGLEFFNVQLGCSDIDIFNTGFICPCGQNSKMEKTIKDSDISLCNESLVYIGSPVLNSDNTKDLFLTGSLFSENIDDKNFVMNSLIKLSGLCSQEAYAAIFSQEQCLKNCSALWFDYVYCMQIVKNDFNESQIDVSNLCNTDGIRESSVTNLYLGQSVFNVDSYFVHNLTEITKAFDTSKYSSYFKNVNHDNRDSDAFYPTEDQVARIHEFIPLRQYNMCFTESKIKINSFLESHNVPKPVPIIELATNLIKFSKSSPMYARNLIDCVSVLNTNLLKESKNLFSKCYSLQSLEVTGLSLSLRIPESIFDDFECDKFINSEIILPCDLKFSYNTLLFAESWKTSSFINDEKSMKMSKINLQLIPSHLKTVYVILASNYSWVVNYVGIFPFTSNINAMNQQLDDITLKMLDPENSLLKACYKNEYEGKTSELHVMLPDFTFKSWRTISSYFVDAKISHDSLFVYLKETTSSKIIPVLDNIYDHHNSPITDILSPFFLLYCQIPIQSNHVNCTFTFHCQVGFINSMFSSQLIDWLTFPILDFNLHDDSMRHSYGPSLKSKGNTVISSQKISSNTRSTADGNSRPQSPSMLSYSFPVPGHPKPLTILNPSIIIKNEEIKFSEEKSGWWNTFKIACSKYFFFLQSLDVCIKVKKSKLYVMTASDSSIFQLNVSSCSQWMEQFSETNKNSIFLITITRLALINSQRKEYLDDNFEQNQFKIQQGKFSTFIESFPWELIFHDIKVDCVHSQLKSFQNSFLVFDSILKPVSINCTLSATPKCSSPERLDTFYSISWGIHVDITEVQPTLKQIYLIKLLDFFVNIYLKVSSSEFTGKHYQLLTEHYSVVKNSNKKLAKIDEPRLIKSKQSTSTRSTKKSISLVSTIERKPISSSYRITNSKLDSQSSKGADISGFKLSFWVQCTLSQFQLIILLKDHDKVDEKKVCLVIQVDDVTGSIDVQEKFVEIKSKFGSLFCQLGVLKDEKIISEVPILKSGSKFLSKPSFLPKMKDESSDDMYLDSVNRHCLSVALIRTTVNNLSQRPLSTYHQFKDTDSFKSYTTEFTGNFSAPLESMKYDQSFVTQISSIVEPFELVISSYFIEQCHILTDRLLSIYLQFFHSADSQHFSANKTNLSYLKVEPYFISEDLPKFHLLIKSSKIIMPCGKNIIDVKHDKSDSVIISWDKISLQPFSDNPISRPEIIIDYSDEEGCSTAYKHSLDNIELDQKTPNSLDDNRQFQLDIINFGIFSSNCCLYSDGNVGEIALPKSIRYADNFGTSVIHGQNPAFEWNYYSKMSTSFHSKQSADDQLKPILNPIDIQVTFAGALYQSSECLTKRQLIGGYGLEVNILSSIEVLADLPSLKNINIAFSNLKKLFSCDNVEVAGDTSYLDGDSELSNNVHSIDEWIMIQKYDHIVPCVPVNILVTTRKIQTLLVLQDSESRAQALCLTISQPHMLFYFKNKKQNKFELSLFDITVSISPTVWSDEGNLFESDFNNYWTSNQHLILAEMKTIMKTKSGHPDIKTGVPKSFFIATYSNFYLSNEGSELSVDFSRQVIVEMDMRDFREILSIITSFFDRTKVLTKKEFKVSNSEKSFSLNILTPQFLVLSTSFLSFTFSDYQYHHSYFQCKVGKITIKSNTLKKHVFNNLQSTIELCCDTVVIVCYDEENIKSRNILGPLKVKGKCLYNKYRIDSVDEYWTSSELCGDIGLGSVNISVDKQDIIFLLTLFNNMLHSYESNESFMKSSQKSEETKEVVRIEMFYDDLRSEHFQINTTVNIDMSSNECQGNVANFGSHIVADDGVVAFSNDGEDLAAMYWTYPEARFITCIEVKPVPFVFIEYKLTKDDNYEQLQVPCQLEYWNSSKNCYELYKEFHLSENQIERIDDFPTLEKVAHMITAKSWRVVFDCYARYMKVNDHKKVSYSEKAMLVYLSPLVLAASMKVDSCYAPSVVKNSFFSITSLEFQMKYGDAEQNCLGRKLSCVPFKEAEEGYDNQTIADHTTLFVVTAYNIILNYASMNEICFSTSKSIFYTVNPFVALKTPIIAVEDIEGLFTDNPQSLTDTNFKVNIRLVQIGIDQSILKQCMMIYESISELRDIYMARKYKKKKFNFHKLWFCNYLDRRIRLRQYQNSFYKICDLSKMGGIAPGEAILLKFLPVNYYQNHNNITKNSLESDSIKLTLGLCSELKGTVRWTKPIEVPNLSYDHVSDSISNLQIWNIDCTSTLDTPICSNSSNLSNSYNAKNLLLLHNQTIKGLNKLILMGNTIFNNLTEDSVNINFSLPTELSSGFSFNIFPSTISEKTNSIHINWKTVFFASPKNNFELSFRCASEISDKVEYRSLSYSLTVPKFDTLSKKYHYDQTIIKLKEHKFEKQVIAIDDHFKQMLCTLEWFHLEKDDIFLLMTLSPLIVCKNMMIHDVTLHLTWTTEYEDQNIKQRTSILEHGSSDKIMDFYPNNALHINASFLNDSKLLFEKPLILTETNILESLRKNLLYMYNAENDDQEHDFMKRKLSCRLMNIIDTSQEKVTTDEYNDNPYSIHISITPWILVTNNTKNNLVLGFDKNIYLLEALSDFVPSQNEKTVKIGIAHENEIFWSNTFLIGNSIFKHVDNDASSDLSWKVMETDVGTEAYLQINIVVSKEKIIVPLTLRQAFARKNTTSYSASSRTCARFNRLTIESSIHVCNQTTFTVNVVPLSFTSNISPHWNSSVKSISLDPISSYTSVEKFQYISEIREDSGDTKWGLSISKSGNLNENNGFSNFVSIIDVNELIKYRESENISYTGFSYIEEPIKGTEEISFTTLVVNSTCDYRTYKVYVDIFESKSVPIKITNDYGKQILVQEYVDDVPKTCDTISKVAGHTSIPLWPYNYLSDINKDGYGRVTNIRIRLGIEINNEFDWTDYFPIHQSLEFYNLNVITKIHRTNLFLHIESSEEAKIHIFIKDHESVLIPDTTFVNSQFSTEILISTIIVSILESSNELELSEETISLRLDQINLFYSYNYHSKGSCRKLSISDIQLDNKRYHSGLYDFPVVLHSVNTKMPLNFFYGSIETDRFDTHSIDLRFEQEIELFIENIFLYDLLRIFAKLAQSISSGPNLGVVSLYTSPPLNLGAVTISSIPIIITVHAFLKIYVSCEATTLSLPKFSFQPSLIKLRTFQKKIYEHYVTAVLIRCGWVMGSFEILGNPTGIVQHLSTGLSNLLCSKNIDHGLLADFLLRILSFCQHTTGGLVSSFTGIASSVSRNLDYLCLDSTHISRQDSFRRQYQPNGVIHGFYQGLSGFALSMLGAIAGLADHPLHASQEAMNNNSSVTIAVLKGLSKGLVGVLTKPLSGTAELFAQTGRGLLRSTGISVPRYHFQAKVFSLISRSDLLINDTNVLIHFLDQQNAKENLMEIGRFVCLWCGIATNFLQKFVYLFIINNSLIEWNIENPLRDKHHIYNLSDYDVTTCSSWTHSTIELHHLKDVGRQRINCECRIDEFLSNQVCDTISPSYVFGAGLKNNSHRSSFDSTEFVDISEPKSNSFSTDIECDQINTMDNEIVIFSLAYPSNGLMDAISCLKLYRENCNDHML